MKKQFLITAIIYVNFYCLAKQEWFFTDNVLREARPFKLSRRPLKNSRATIDSMLASLRLPYSMIESKISLFFFNLKTTRIYVWTYPPWEKGVKQDLSSRKHGRCTWTVRTCIEKILFISFWSWAVFTTNGKQRSLQNKAQCVIT